MSHTTITDGIYFSIQQTDGAQGPKPLVSGFSEDYCYLALGLFNPSETSEAYFILANDRNEVWFISNRHLRFNHIDKHSSSPRIRLRAKPLESA